MDYYYLKDIILGLKKEYDNYSYILNDLKDSISINDKLLVNNINLYVYENWSMKNPELICDIYRNKKIFDKLYSKLIESDSYDRINLYKDSIYKHGKLKIYFNSNLFNKKYDLLMNSPFVNKIYIWMISNIDHNGFLSIGHNFIKYHGFNNSLDFDYNPITGDFKITNPKNGIDKKIINNIFYIKFPKDKFFEYHKKMIESSNLNCYCYVDCNEYDSMILDCNKELVLRNKSNIIK